MHFFVKKLVGWVLCSYDNKTIMAPFSIEYQIYCTQGGNISRGRMSHLYPEQACKQDQASCWSSTNAGMDWNGMDYFQGSNSFFLCNYALSNRVNMASHIASYECPANCIRINGGILCENYSPTRICLETVQ